MDNDKCMLKKKYAVIPPADHNYAILCIKCTYSIHIYLFVTSQIWAAVTGVFRAHPPWYVCVCVCLCGSDMWWGQDVSAATPPSPQSSGCATTKDRYTHTRVLPLLCAVRGKRNTDVISVSCSEDGNKYVFLTFRATNYRAWRRRRRC